MTQDSLASASATEYPAFMQFGPDSEFFDGFKELPETIRVYRGCDLQDRRGLSFSLSYDMARSFPFRHRYYAEWPAV